VGGKVGEEVPGKAEKGQGGDPGGEGLSLVSAGSM